MRKAVLRWSLGNRSDSCFSSLTSCFIPSRNCFNSLSYQIKNQFLDHQINSIDSNLFGADLLGSDAKVGILLLLRPFDLLFLRPRQRFQFRVVSSQQTGRLLIETALLLVSGHLGFDRQILKLFLFRLLEHFQLAQLLFAQQVLVVDAAVILVGVENLRRTKLLRHLFQQLGPLLTTLAI